MQILQAFVAYTLVITIGATRLDINSADCSIYTGKFGLGNKGDGAGVSKIAFTGDAAFLGNTSNVKVNLRYSDSDYFNDPIHWGLVEQDGKAPETTCLDMKLYYFPASDFKNGVQITDLTIKPSNNTQKQQRSYSFIIKGTDLSKRLIQTLNSNNYVYKGYYGIVFYAAGTDQMFYNFYFDFAVTVKRSTGAAVEAAFKSISLTASAGCTTGELCNITAQSSLQWCTDFTCAAFSQPDLHLNDQFVLLQSITTEGMNNFYLTETEAWYTSDGLNKKATIISIDNTIKGQVKILLKAEIAWRHVTIYVISTLNNALPGRFLAITSAAFDTVLAQTEVIKCIKAQNESTCPTCEQECAANGYAEDICPPCDDKAELFSAILILFFVFII